MRQAFDRVRRQVEARHLWIGAGLTAGLAILYLVSRTYFPILYNPGELRAFIQSFGPLAPVVYIGIMIAQIVYAPLPGQFVYVVGGYTFGNVLGTVYGMIGIAIGSWMAMALSRRYGRPFVERHVSEDVIERFDDFTEAHGLFPFFVIFLLPGFPDDAVCFLAGLSNLRIRDLLAIAILGRFPGLVALILAGNGIAKGQTLIVIILVVITAVVSAAALIFREKIFRYAKEKDQEDGGLW